MKNVLMCTFLLQLSWHLAKRTTVIAIIITIIIIVINNNSGAVERVHDFKLLGVYVDSTLSWTKHVEYIVKNATKRLVDE